MAVKRKWFYAFGIEALFLLLTIGYPERFYISLALVIWINLLIYALEDVNNRSPLLSFILAFFAFLMGRELLEQYGLHSIELNFSKDLDTLASKLLVISLISFCIGYFVSGNINKNKLSIKGLNKQSSNYSLASIRKSSVYLFYATYIFYLVSILDTVRFVIQHGYYALYESYSSSLPYVIVKIGDMAIVAFWVYLATMPSKKECKAPIILYILSLVLSLGTGQRYPFVAGLLTLFVYFTFRNTHFSMGDIWFSKTALLVSFISLPFLMVLLSIVNVVRFGLSDNSSFLDNVTGFIYSTGVSINFIKRTVFYDYALPQGKLYSFGQVIDVLQSNIVSRLMGVKYYSGNTIEHALYGNSLAHSLSYIVLGNSYLRGSGLGCSYIAETYHDFKSVGVVLVNIIYGALIRKAFVFDNKRVWFTTICFLAFNALLLAPRGNADLFIAKTIDLTTWGTFLLIYLLALWLKQYKTDTSIR